MLQNLIICIQAVIPLSIYLAIGHLARRGGLINEAEVHRFNKLVFTVFFPPLMFENLYTAAITEALRPHLILYAVVCVLLLVALSIPLVSAIESKPETRGAMIQGIYRSNFILMGLPVAINIFGRGNVAVTAGLIMVIVPLYNVLAVIILEYFRGGRTTAAEIFAKIASNPIILGAVTALVTMASDIQIPDTVSKVVATMAEATTPMALILLGASFSVQSVRSNRRNVSLVVIGRLIIAPAIGLTGAMLLGFRDIEFVSLLIMMAAPTAISSFPMAESMGSDGELAGNVVIFTTPLSCLTIFLWLFLFKSLGAF